MMGHSTDLPRRMIEALIWRPLRRSAALVNPRTARVGCSKKSRLVTRRQSISDSATQPPSGGGVRQATRVAVAKAEMRERIRIVCGWVVRTVRVQISVGLKFREKRRTPLGFITNCYSLSLDPRLNDAPPRRLSHGSLIVYDYGWSVGSVPFGPLVRSHENISLRVPREY